MTRTEQQIVTQLICSVDKGECVFVDCERMLSRLLISAQGSSHKPTSQTTICVFLKQMQNHMVSLLGLMQLLTLKNTTVPLPLPSFTFHNPL